MERAKTDGEVRARRFIEVDPAHLQKVMKQIEFELSERGSEKATVTVELTEDVVLFATRRVTT